MLRSLARETKTHLSNARETYVEHLRFAATVSMMLLAAGLACFVHALVPAVCQTTASRTIRRLAELMDDRGRLDEIGRESSEAIAFALMVSLALVPIAAIWIAGGSWALLVPLSILALGLPAAFLAANPDLEPAAG